MTKLLGLKNLDCSNNGIASLNLYQNTLLETLYCANNDLTSLGVTANTALEVLDCSGNQLTALDVTKNSALQTLNCSNNMLSSLDVSRNTALETITCTGNVSLEKLWVKNAAHAAAINIQKDATTNIYYNDGGINIPDAKLKAYLLALFDDDEDGEISILESENVQNVNCSGRGVSDLTGLECCTNLKYLNFSGNSVSIAELPNLPHLETIVAYGNPISRINVTNDTALTALFLQDVSTNAASGTMISINGYDQSSSLSLAFANTPYTRLEITNSTGLTSLDITENIQLIELVASGNPGLTTLNVSPLTDLALLDVNSCGLTALNVDTNINLVTLDCSSNDLTALNVDNNVALVTFDCSDNALATIRVSNNTLLEAIDVSDNQLLNINIRKNTLLKNLNVSGNASITALALGYNTALETLNASGTALTDIDLAVNTALKNLDLSGCTGISIIDLTGNTALKNLNLRECAGISILDLTANAELEILNISGTAIPSLDASINPSLWTLICDDISPTGLKIGTYVKLAGQGGIVFHVSGGITKIVSTDEEYSGWWPDKETGATSLSDGVANTNKLQSSWAATWARGKGLAWYLPARDELLEVYNNKMALNTTLSAIGETPFSNRDYWSSTECDSQLAYSVYFYNGDVYKSRKGTSHTYYYRAIRVL